MDTLNREAHATCVGGAGRGTRDARWAEGQQQLEVVVHHPHVALACLGVCAQVVLCDMGAVPSQPRRTARPQACRAAAQARQAPTLARQPPSPVIPFLRMAFTQLSHCARHGNKPNCSARGRREQHTWCSSACAMGSTAGIRHTKGRADLGRQQRLHLQHALLEQDTPRAGSGCAR